MYRREYSGKDLLFLDSNSLHCFIGKSTLSGTLRNLFHSKMAVICNLIAFLPLVTVPRYHPILTELDLHGSVQTPLFISRGNPDAWAQPRFGAVLAVLLISVKFVEDDANGHGHKEPAL